jgi:mutator protein MutT
LDLELKFPEHAFNVRAAAILIVDGKVLLQRRIGDAAWALPGGKVAYGETAAEAVVRELREEFALEAIVTRLVWLAESFFKLEGCDVHQLGLYYLVHADAPNAVQPVEPSLETCWLALAELAMTEVQPAFLRACLRDLPTVPTPLVDRH